MSDWQHRRSLREWLNDNVADNGVGYIPRKAIIGGIFFVVAFHGLAILRLSSNTANPASHSQPAGPGLVKPGPR